MLVGVIFILGVGNFALHRAVFDCAHPILSHMPFWSSAKGRTCAFALEFGFLLGAMALAVYGVNAAIWLYGLYSLLNGLSGWMIMSGRI